VSEDPRRHWGEALSLAFTLVGLVVVCTGVGYGADRLLHTGPWLMVAGVFVGAVLGFAYLVYLLFAGSSSGEGTNRSKPGGGATGGR
jgi:F0F1-type ATP synthase assembly protein I